MEVGKINALLRAASPFEELLLCGFYLFNSWNCDRTTEDARSTRVFLLYGQLSQGRMADFPAFIASKSFDLWNHHIPQMKWHNIVHLEIRVTGKIKVHFRNSLNTVMWIVQGGNKYNNNLDMTCNILEGFVYIDDILLGPRYSYMVRRTGLIYDEVGYLDCWKLQQTGVMYFLHSY